jgi:hypothetical protein
MRPQAWHVFLLLYPLVFAVVVLVLYWVIRLAVRAGIRDADERRAATGSGHAEQGPPSS